jgi:iron complex outermembrane receptor protein
MVSEHSVSAPASARATVPGWLIKVAVATALAGATAVPLHAQEAPAASPPAEESPDVGEVVITGSRIQRPDFASDSPTVSVSSQALQNTAEVGIDQQLTKLPQFVPGANQVTSAVDIQATPTNSPGIATVNLRGLGANRTLVLLDGRRTQPNNASMVVDLNTIPAAAIDSVEIITGGAAATYGADAVAGVVNFKLKRNYTGVTVTGQESQTFHGDGRQSQISALMGSNFADNRGNALIGVNYSKRDEIFTLDREFQSRAYSDPGTPGVNTFNNFGGFAGSAVPGTASQAALNAVFGAKGYAPGDVRTTDTLYFNTAATTGGASLFTIGPGAVSKAPAPGFTGDVAYPNLKMLSNGTLASNSPGGFLSLPLTRYSLFANGHYDFNDNASFYVQANFDQNETRTQSGGHSPAVLQWSVTIPRDAGHPVPTELATLLDSRVTAAGAPLPANTAWVLNKDLDYMGNTSLRTKTNTYEIVAGIRGELGFKDWTYDFFGTHGDTNQTTAYQGFVDLARYQALINMPNYGANADFNNGRTGLLAHCTSGLNPFVNTPVSQDCKDIINAGLKTNTSLQQKQVELDIQGALFPMPAGDMRFAVGADYRSDDFEYLPDGGLSTQNITSLTIGLFDTSATRGKIAVKEGYVELLAPILKDKPFVQSLSLDGGYRYSKYDTTAGGVSTWKLTADYAMTDWVRFRGGRQNANRAPNVAELFQPAVFSTVPWPDHDPCSIVTRAAFGNVASNPNRKQVQALCTTLSGGFAIGDTFTGNQAVYFPLGRDLTRGNPDVKSEQAKTWTFGTVLRSPFDAIALKRLTLAVDYYSIDINAAISPATTATVYQQCFNAFGTNPTYDANNPYCKLIIRSPVNGFWIATNALYQNLGSIKTSGIDTQLDWSMDTPFFGGHSGTVFANINFNYLKKYDVQAFVGGPTTHYVDTIGAAISSAPYGAQFRWKSYTNLGYSVGPASVAVAWRHLPGARHFASATSSAGQLPVASYDQFDLSARWSVTEAFTVQLGVDNLFDRQPLTVGVIPGVTNAAGVTDPAGSYDVIGRRAYLGATAKF